MASGVCALAAWSTCSPTSGAGRVRRCPRRGPAHSRHRSIAGRLACAGSRRSTRRRADMRMTREQLARLERDASSMATANHGRYMSDAIPAMRDPAFAGGVADDVSEAPLRALRLLDAMWGSAHASRQDQRAALSDVGVWLERRL